MTPALTKLLVALAAGSLYIASVYFPDVETALVALAGLVTGTLTPQVGASRPGDLGEL